MDITSWVDWCAVLGFGLSLALAIAELLRRRKDGMAPGEMEQLSLPAGLRSLPERVTSGAICFSQSPINPLWPFP